MTETTKEYSNNDLCISVTTYKKNDALENWLNSVVNFGRVKVVHIADDADGNAQPVAEAFQKKYESGEYPFPIFYSTGPNKGIACNKNRGIKFFLTAPEAAECSYLVLSDDDIVFTDSEIGEKHIGDLMLKACQNAGLQHVMGFLGGQFGKVNEDGTVTGLSEPFFVQFPPIAEDEYIIQCGGTQGILLFFYRQLVEKLGYFTQFPGKYGYEHAEYSMRANRLEGRCPDLYPIVKNCGRYFHCQGIPNNYEANPTENTGTYQKRYELIMNGVDLVKKNPGI